MRQISGPLCHEDGFSAAGFLAPILSHTHSSSGISGCLGVAGHASIYATGKLLGGLETGKEALENR